MLVMLITQAIIADTGGNPQAKAAATTTLFLLICAVYIVLSLLIVIKTVLKYKSTITKKLLVIKLLGHVLTAIAGLFYLLGDNITTIVLEYKDQLNCDCETECVNIVANIATAMLVIAILIFRLTPPFLTKLKAFANTHSSKETQWSYWRVTAQSVALIIELDAWFSAVAEKPLKSPKYCPTHELGLAWVLYAVSLLLFLMYLTLVAVPAVTEAVKGKLKKIVPIKTGVTLGIIWLCSSITLLSGNYQPLGCVFGCDQLAADMENECDINGDNTTCNRSAHIGTRTGLLLLNNVMLVTIIALLICHWRFKARYKRALQKRSQSLYHRLLPDMTTPTERTTKGTSSIKTQNTTYV